MELEELETLLVAGVNTRPIVSSAKDLGLSVVAVDCFDDIDLNEQVDHLYTVDQDSDKEGVEHEKIFELVSKVLDSHEIDAAIFTSGLEHYPERIEELGKRVDILGNSEKQLSLCEDKEKLFDIAEDLGIPHPVTEKVGDLDEALDIADNLEYPVLLKPSSSGGGIGIELVRDSEELQDSFNEVLKSGDENYIYIQQFIRGIDASTSVISTGTKSKTLTVNEQIIGDKRLDAPRRFGYCGNIIPLPVEKEIETQISQYSEKICTELGLKGSNGVDFIIADKLYLIEVNPRFQNTIDIVEESLEINLVKAHIKSINQKLIKKTKPKKSSAKLVIYARHDFQAPDLTKFSIIVDIPQKNSTINKGEPVCSVKKSGKNRNEVVKKAYKTADKLQKTCYK